MQDYRKLRVHMKAHALMLAVKRATLRFPRRGYADLVRQISNAAESIPFNIVEGCGADTPKEFARFLGISIKSTMELEYQLSVATDYGVLPSSEGDSLRTETTNTRRMLCGLRAKVLASAESAPAAPPSRPTRTTHRPSAATAQQNNGKTGNTGTLARRAGALRHHQSTHN